jgi:hypothetical protein
VPGFGEKVSVQGCVQITCERVYYCMLSWISIPISKYKIRKRNPSILKPALLQQLLDKEGTYDWDMISNILVVCGAFAAAVLATSNVAFHY